MLPGSKQEWHQAWKNPLATNPKSLLLEQCNVK